MKQTPKEIIAILTAIADGAKWEAWESNGSIVYVSNSTVNGACAILGRNGIIRLKKEPKMVPLGPEDFVGQCWWIRNPETLGPRGNPELVTKPCGLNFHCLKEDGWERTNDERTGIRARNSLNKIS